MRKQIMTTIAAVALLVAAGPMAAQETTPESETDVKWERTQPNADSQAPHAGLTIYGTVQEVNEDQLTLKSSTGVQHIQIVENTRYPSDLATGTEVAVDYTRNTQGVMIADEIRLGSADAMADVDVGTEPMQTEPATTTTATVETDVESDLAASDVESDLDVDAEAETDLAETDTRDYEYETTTTADYDTDETTMTADAELPATGSDLPLIALLGLIGVAGAGALHVLRS